MRFGPLAPMTGLKQLILWGWGIVRYKVTRGDPQIPTEIRETPETGLEPKIWSNFRILLINLDPTDESFLSKSART